MTKIRIPALSWYADDTDLLCKDADLNGFFTLIRKMSMLVILSEIEGHVSNSTKIVLAPIEVEILLWRGSPQKIETDSGISS
jgi:hypothetical protein